MMSSAFIERPMTAKFDDSLRLHRGIEQLLVVFWGYNTSFVGGLVGMVSLEFHYYCVMNTTCLLTKKTCCYNIKVL